ncbi:hypothetical protein EIP86_003266 [Pleurotus ostreatoroseus]|nr:hypothetical protein EIP86_003266 [Pleurotus ostreatoroseus]
MSARQPFVPQQRPASRQANGSNPDAKAKLDDVTFKPNGLLDSVQGNHEQQVPGNPHQRGGSNIASLVNKPLNLAGFAKTKKPHNVALPFGNKSFDEDASRARSPNPRSAHQSMRIAMPSPFFPSTAGFVPVSAFRKAALPTSAPTLPSTSSTDGFGSNQAHIPAKPPGLDLSDSAHTSNLPQPGPPSHSRIRSSSRPSLEKIHEVAEEEENMQQYTNNNTQAGHHDSIDMYHSSSSPIPEQQHPIQMDVPYSNNAGFDRGEPMKPGLRRVQKRFLRTDEVEESSEYGHQTKKSRAGVEDDQQNAYYASEPPVLSQYNPTSQETAYDDNPFQMQQAHAPFVEQAQRVPGRDASVYEAPASTSAGDISREEHALRRLLGQDLDAYVDTHTEAYEQARKKWTECTVDEWKAGADELVIKFTKLLDFVKDHMTTKLLLYANLDQALDAHRTVLSKRDDALQDTHATLVKEAGQVIAGKLDGTANLMPGSFTSSRASLTNAPLQAQDSTTPGDAMTEEGD